MRSRRVASRHTWLWTRSPFGLGGERTLTGAWLGSFAVNGEAHLRPLAGLRMEEASDPGLRPGL